MQYCPLLPGFALFQLVDMPQLTFLINNKHLVPRNSQPRAYSTSEDYSTANTIMGSHNKVQFPQDRQQTGEVISQYQKMENTNQLLRVGWLHGQKCSKGSFCYSLLSVLHLF